MLGEKEGTVCTFKTLSVSRFQTSPCMPATRAHVFQHVRVVPVHTGTPHTPNHDPTQHNHTQHTHKDNTHNTPHRSKEKRRREKQREDEREDERKEKEEIKRSEIDQEIKRKLQRDGDEDVLFLKNV